jgi:hypothetical protein
MARLTKHQEGEIVEMFYGINPKTFEVDRVSLTRGGTLSRWNKNGNYSHPVFKGRDARAEVIIVFGLTDIHSVSQVSFGSEYEKRILEELKTKAAEMKAASQKK